MSLRSSETLSLPEPSTRSRRYATPWRIALLLVLSFLLHALIIGALPGLPDFKSEEPPPIEATIQMPPPPVPAPVLPQAVAPSIAHHALAKPPPAPEPPPLQQPQPVIATPNGVAIGPSSDTVSSPADAGTLAASAPVVPSEAPVAQSAPAAPPAAPPAARPVDAVLDYDAVALDPKNPDQRFVGKGTLSFHTDATSYHATLDVHVSLLFVPINFLSSQSSGSIGVDGLEPASYNEALRNKSAEAASIARDANGNPSTVNYGRGETAAALPGLQDHLSVLLQIGGLIQSNPALREPGVHFVVPVLGNKGAIEAWNLAVVARESVATGQGNADAWHIMRMRRPGSNDRGVDVWVGDHPAGVPLRILYTETNGSTIDLKLTSAQ